MRLGYSYWGFLGDYKMDADGNELSTPDGNATYGWSIIHEAQRRGWLVFSLQEDRDIHAWRKMGPDLFGAFSKEKRTAAYNNMYKMDGTELPDLDVVLVEWRFPIPGRNTPDVKGQPGYQRDLECQERILYHYLNKGVPVILWDLDHKILPSDEAKWAPTAIFETSVTPRRQLIDRIRVEPPFVINDLMQHKTLSANPFNKLVYVGSRYERDDVITEYIKPASDKWPFHVRFYGNWLKTVEECRKLWPRVDYNDRITTRDFRKVYGEAVACPLLAKRSYIETGFITPRPWEALLFGTLPVGISQAKGIDQYCLFTARDGEDMIQAVEHMKEIRYEDRHRLREEHCHRLLFMDVSNFVNEIEKVANGSVALAERVAGPTPAPEGATDAQGQS